MHHAILRAFDNTTYTATVQLTGSLAQWLRTVPVNRAIPAAEMTAGRKVVVFLTDPTKATDAVVLAVYA